MKESNSPLGGHLRRLRKSVGLKLREVEEATGISNAYLSQLELGRRAKPSAEVLGKLAKVYGVATRSLLREAGYLEVAEEGASDPTEDERLTWAFECVLRDPAYRYGKGLLSEEPDALVKRFVIEIYQTATGRMLLDSESARGHTMTIEASEWMAPSLTPFEAFCRQLLADGREPLGMPAEDLADAVRDAFSIPNAASIAELDHIARRMGLFPSGWSPHGPSELPRPEADGDQLNLPYWKDHWGSFGPRTLLRGIRLLLDDQMLLVQPDSVASPCTDAQADDFAMRLRLPRARFQEDMRRAGLDPRELCREYDCDPRTVLARIVEAAPPQTSVCCALFTKYDFGVADYPELAREPPPSVAPKRGRRTRSATRIPPGWHATSWHWTADLALPPEFYRPSWPGGVNVLGGPAIDGGLVSEAAKTGTTLCAPRLRLNGPTATPDFVAVARPLADPGGRVAHIAVVAVAVADAQVIAPLTDASDTIEVQHVARI